MLHYCSLCHDQGPFFVSVDPFGQKLKFVAKISQPYSTLKEKLLLSQATLCSSSHLGCLSVWVLSITCSPPFSHPLIQTSSHPSSPLETHLLIMGLNSSLIPHGFWHSSCSIAPGARQLPTQTVTSRDTGYFSHGLPCHGHGYAKILK